MFDRSVIEEFCVEMDDFQKHKNFLTKYLYLRIKSLFIYLCTSSINHYFTASFSHLKQELSGTVLLSFPPLFI